MKPGIETTRRVFRLDEVAEHRLNNWRLRNLQESEDAEEACKDRTKLERAEAKLIEAVERYMKLGASKELVLRVVESAIG